MFNAILLPVDGSPSSLAAVDSAVAMAKAFSATLCVVTVIDPYPFTAVGPDLAQGRAHYLAATRQVAADAINSACQMVNSRGMSARAMLCEAHLVWKGILETAQTCNADLIIMSSHGQRGSQRWVLGGVTQQLLQHSTIPVLVVNDAERTPGTPAWVQDVWRSARAKSERLAYSQRRR